MVVCKFFLQGTCKFGAMCKFEHDVNESRNTYSQSIMRSANFAAPQMHQHTQQKLPTKEEQTVDSSMLVKSVVTDMTQAEKGGQWLFSCYAPFKEKPAFPGFEDQSFEEIRLGYYEAVKSGTVEQYKQQIQGMAQEAILKVRSLQNPSMDIVNMLTNIYNSRPSTQAGTFTGNTASNFSFRPTSSIFSQPNQNQHQNIFHTQTNQTSIFGNNQILQQNQPFMSQQVHQTQHVQQTQPVQQIQHVQQNVFVQPQSNFNHQQQIAATKPQVYSQSIFGNNQTKVQENVDHSVYSKLEDLTQEEINWFKSDDLDIMKIPEKPPAYEMCL